MISAKTRRTRRPARASIRTHISFDPEMHAELSQLAQDRGVAMNDLVIEAVQKLLKVVRRSADK